MWDAWDSVQNCVDFADDKHQRQLWIYHFTQVTELPTKYSSIYGVGAEEIPCLVGLVNYHMEYLLDLVVYSFLAQRLDGHSNDFIDSGGRYGYNVLKYFSPLWPKNRANIAVKIENPFIIRSPFLVFHEIPCRKRKSHWFHDDKFTEIHENTIKSITIQRPSPIFPMKFSYIFFPI